ncbi:MAG: FimB/Mfa2 family fimbrial subunit [Odoribacteraceae bacterium]|jgi:hypothetical protein|nr:FimB/Mfa2 family fimbrial subunit [Odoribacteraceae bacterium]
MIKYIPTFLVLVGLGLSNCVRDSLEDCPYGKYICLRSAVHKYKVEDVARELLLYLYDHRGDLVDTFRFSTTYLVANDYTVLVPLQDSGSYSVVALLNPSAQHYEIAGAEALTTFRTILKPDRADTIARKPSDLFYAHKGMVYSKPKHFEYDTIYFYKSTVHFNVYVRLDDYKLPKENALFVAIDGNNGIFDYLNAKSTRRLYLPYMAPVVSRVIQEEYHYQIETMDFRTTDRLTLLVHETGPYTARADTIHIVEALKGITLHNGSHPYDTNEKLAQEDEYDLTVVLDAGFKILELKMNDWYTIKGGVEL